MVLVAGCSSAGPEPAPQPMTHVYVAMTAASTRLGVFVDDRAVAGDVPCERITGVIRCHDPRVSFELASRPGDTRIPSTLELHGKVVDVACDHLAIDDPPIEGIECVTR
jgi:hypothetical protein